MRSIALALTAAIAMAAPADAKEIEKLVVCGADRCSDATKQARGRRAEPDGAAATRPKQRAPYYLLHFAIGDRQGHVGAEFTSAWIPSKRLLRGRDEIGGYTWIRVPPALAHDLRRLTRGRRPFPARRLKLGAPNGAAPSSAPPVGQPTTESAPVPPTAPAQPTREGTGGDGPGLIGWFSAAVAVGTAAGLWWWRRGRRAGEGG